MLLFFFYLPALAQIFPAGERVLYNLGSQLVMDVKGGNTAAKTRLWQYNMNLTDAQYFRFERVNTVNDSLYYIKSVLSGLYITVSYEMVNALPASSGGNSNYNFRVYQDVKLPPPATPGVALLPTAVYDKNQRWKFIPVAGGTENEFIIQSVRYASKVLRPMGSESGSWLILGDYASTNIKRWRAIPMQRKATGVAVTDFVYNTDTDIISGKLSWNDNSSNETSFRIMARSSNSGGSWQVANVPANTEQYNFVFTAEQSRQGIYLNHCFTVTPSGSLESNRACAVPRQIGTPNQPAATIVVYDRAGCYSQCPTGCTGGIRLRFSPVSLTGTTGTSDVLNVQLGNGITQTRHPNTCCCVWSVSNFTGLKTGTWKMEKNTNGFYSFICNVTLSSGSNIIKVCSDNLSRGCTVNAFNYPCD